jgi:hypothetical protein
MKIKDYKKLNNVTALKKAHAKVTKWFNLYIRLKSLSWFKNTSHYGIVGECKTCGAVWEVELFSDKSIMNGKKWHCGHYWKSDSYASVRYDERNVALQCYNCNRNLSGNESNFETYLRKKLGDDGFEQLKIDRNKVKHWDIAELDKLADIYKLKAQLEANRLQIKI